MYFALSKVLWILFAPSHVLGWLTILSAVFFLSGFSRAGRTSCLMSCALLVLMGILPLGVWLVRPLEDWYPRANLPGRVDGILILGGGLDPDMLASRGAMGAGQGEARLISGVELVRRYPRARVVFSGGSGSVFGATATESQVAAYVFRQVGLAPNRVVLEDRSRNTWENFVFSKRLAHPQTHDVWVLATSAIQMPRAMEAARKVGWNVVPWPADYLTAPEGLSGYFDVPRNLDLVDAGFHEWVGLLVYR